MYQSKKSAVICCALLFSFLSISFSAFSQKKKAIPTIPVDTVKKKIPPVLTDIKPYQEIVPAGSKTMNGFFKVHLVKNRYLFEIPDSLLKRDILAVTRIEKGAQEFIIPLFNIGFSGDELGRAVISFDKIPGDKLALRSRKFGRLATDTTGNGLYRSLSNNEIRTIEAAFPIKAINTDRKSTVIDVTDFFSGSNMISAFIQPIPLIGDLFTALSPDRSYIGTPQVFPENIEMKTVKTFTFNKALTTMELNTSILLLPKTPMKPRLKDPRIGFFANNYIDFDADAHRVSPTQYIQRWRMEPKDADITSYQRGELVEPKKPIVIYIDPATPQKWVPYLIAGINDWNAAFEKAGFKNAIIGKTAPLNDSTWSMNDARHSVVVYKPSAVANASGPNVNDPRSGEILETHINWYHQVMDLIENWYVIQAGAIDPRTHRPELDDKLMGQLIRFVSSHEVGHTLGLMHNFGASSTVDVEKLRNKAWVEAHGHTPSIMDYARFNYVAQPEDQISEKGIFPRIGDYDKWAIEWGYKWLPQFQTAEQEKSYLNKWMVEKLASGKQFFYGSQLDPITDSFPMNTIDPRDQSEDLGNDAMLASAYGIKNMKRIKPNLMAWTYKKDHDYTRAGELYKEMVTQFGRFMGHVQRNIGGLYVTPKTVEQPGPEYQIVEKDKQKRAMAFLSAQLFKTPTWLMDSKLYMVSQTDFSLVTKIQKDILRSLLNKEKVTQLLNNENNYPGKAYAASAMLSDLQKAIFPEASNQPADPYLRDLQNQYVSLLIPVLKSEDLNASQTLLESHALNLAEKLKAAGKHSTNANSKAHLNSLYRHLKRALDVKMNTVANARPNA